MSHPLQQTHLLEVGAGVGQPLQCVCQVVVSAEVEAVCSQHIVNHGQESLILLRLKEEREQSLVFRKTLRTQNCILTFPLLITQLYLSADMEYQSDTSSLFYPHLKSAYLAAWTIFAR